MADEKGNVNAALVHLPRHGSTQRSVVFQVGVFSTAPSVERNAKLLLHGLPWEAEFFARGMARMGAKVRTFMCDELNRAGTRKWCPVKRGPRVVNSN